MSTAVGRALRIHSILSLGGTGTGVKFHSHSENWLAQVQGRKGWSLLPPASSGAEMRPEWKEASGCALPRCWPREAPQESCLARAAAEWRAMVVRWSRS